MREIESPGGVQEHCERRRGLHVGRNRVECPRVRQGRGLLVAEALIEQASTALLNQRELLRIGGRVGGVEQRRGLDLQRVRARSDVRDADVKSEICEAQRLDRAQLLERPLGILEPLLEEISRAQAHYHLEEYQPAVDDLTVAIESGAINDTIVGIALATRASAYRKMGDWARALADFDAAIALGTINAKMYFHRGLTLEADGQRARAIEDFRRAYDMAPDNDAFRDKLLELGEAVD